MPLATLREHALNLVHALLYADTGLQPVKLGQQMTALLPKPSQPASSTYRWFGDVPNHISQNYGFFQAPNEVAIVDFLDASTAVSLYQHLTEIDGPNSHNDLMKALVSRCWRNAKLKMM